MKGISENGERNVTLFEHGKYGPKVTMQNGIAAGDIKIREAVNLPAHIHTLPENLYGFFNRDLYEAGMSLGKYVTMLTALIATVSYMPLKCKIVHNHITKISGSDTLSQGIGAA